MAQFILDIRERKIQDIFRSNSIAFQSKQLDLGDIVIVYESKVLPEIITFQPGKEEETNTYTSNVIIERKTFTDLKASIIDNRYHEQKSRLLALPKGTCYYILENNDKHYESLDKKTFLGMYVNTIIRDGIPVFISDSIEETFNILIKISENLNQYGLQWQKISCPLDGSQIKKKKNITKEQVYEQQLCCFSGISAKKAQKIMSIYTDMESLIFAIKNATFKVPGIGNVLYKNIKTGLGII